VSTIYAAHEQARRATIESIREAEHGLAIARNPPSVVVSEANGSVIATITSDLPLTIRLVIVRFAGGATRVVGSEIPIEPYKETNITLYRGACRPFQLLLVPEDGPPLRYPEKGYYCDPAATPRADPWTGKPVVYVQVEPALSVGEPLFSANITINITGDLMRTGPSRLRPLEIRVNGSYLGRLTSIENKVGGYRVANATLELRGLSVGDAYLVMMELVPENGQDLVWEGIVDARLSYRASYSQPQDICTDSQTWLAPVPLGAINHAFSLKGSCVSKAVIFYSYEGSLNASSRFITAGRAILLAALNGAYARIDFSAHLQIRAYRVEAPLANTTIPLESPVASLRLVRPLPAAGPRASALDRVNINITKLLDPLLLRVTVSGAAGPLGSLEIDSASPTVTIRAGMRNLSLTVEAVQPLPPTAMRVLVVDDKTVFWNKTEKRHELTGYLEDTGRPQPWAFPARLLIGNETEIMIAMPPPIAGFSPVDSVFAGPLELEADGNITALQGWPNPYRYAAWPGAGLERTYGASVSAERLAEDFGHGSLVYIYTAEDQAGLPWGEEPVYAGQELWIN
ncbi:MAG: hypothetical protein F7C34_04510, partial [Desulfurococcales archaeon]|nr:hypothetical protein [Desulfurococcales archaeon]